MYYSRSVSAIAAVQVAAVLGVFPALAQEPLAETSLKMIGSSSFMPLYTEHERPFWTEVLLERSDGKIKVDITSHNEAGLKGPEMLRILQMGVADVTSPIFGYLASDNPINEAIDLAGISPDAETARKVSEAWQAVVDEEYREKHSATVLGVLTYPAQVIFCKDEISSLADLEGRKVRTGNRSLAEFVEAVGATSVTMPIGDVVPALERGVVDCAITGTLTGYQQKWYEVTDYIYGLKLGWSQSATIVNLKTWEAMPEQNREFIQTEFDSYEDRVWASVAEQTEQGLDCLTGRAECPLGEAADMTLVEVKPEDQQLLDRIVQETIVPQWVSRCGEGCAEKWNASIAPIIGVTAQAN